MLNKNESQEFQTSSIENEMCLVMSFLPLSLRPGVLHISVVFNQIGDTELHGGAEHR